MGDFPLDRMALANKKAIGNRREYFDDPQDERAPSVWMALRRIHYH